MILRGRSDDSVWVALPIDDAREIMRYLQHNAFVLRSLMPQETTEDVDSREDLSDSLAWLRNALTKVLDTGLAQESLTGNEVRVIYGMVVLKVLEHDVLVRRWGVIYRMANFLSARWGWPTSDYCYNVWHMLWSAIDYATCLRPHETSISIPRAQAIQLELYGPQGPRILPSKAFIAWLSLAQGVNSALAERLLSRHGI